ncbi:MAG: hypothetical protein HY242_01535 [Afipia sp.]|nr:hypothetical protein [Afipia sp.]
MPERRVIVVSPNPTIELTYFCKDFSLHGLNDADARVAAGGKGVNVVRIMRTLGGSPVLVTCLGGIFGNFIYRELHNAEIHCEFVNHTKEARFSTVIYQDGQPEATIVRTDGSALEDAIQHQFVELLDRQISTDSLVCISGSLPAGFTPTLTETICQISLNRNSRTVVDVAGAPLLSALNLSPFLVKVNSFEICKTIGIDFTAMPDPNRLVEATIARGAQNAIVTLGRAGWIACVDGAYFCCSIDANTDGFDIGAGDAMTAGLLHGLQRGYSWAETLKFATRVAAASTYCRSAGEISFERVHSLPDCRIQLI